MEKVLLHESLKDQLTGRSYYAGELAVDEEIPAYLAAKAVGAGLAEVVEGDSPLPAGDEEAVDPGSVQAGPSPADQAG